ncbi:MAG: trypsin-like peptidase domain-containing protein [Phycisphaerales bacterium]|nr:trypsin-like peptidase domain-containing protein [Phycisphaerales bacterium]
MPTPRKHGQTRRQWLFAAFAVASAGLSVGASSEPASQPSAKPAVTSPAATPAPPAPAVAPATTTATIDLTDVITSVVLIRVKTDLGNGTVSISEGTGVYLGSGKVLTASHVVSAYTTIEVVFLPPPRVPTGTGTNQTQNPLKLAAGSSQVIELPAPSSAPSPPSPPSPAPSTKPGASTSTNTNTNSGASAAAPVTVAFDPTRGKLLSYPTADVSLLTNIAAPAWAKPAKIAPRKVALNDATVSVGVQRDLVRRVRTGVVVDTTSSPHTFHATAASQKGDSGGPTFNAKGEVVGILSGIMTAQWKRPDGSTLERTTSVSFNVAGMAF